MLNDSFPHLELQIRINRRLVPILFISSVVFYIGTFIINKWKTFFSLMAHVLDHTLNNMLMFYTLFGYVSYDEMDAKIRQRIENLDWEINKDNCIELGLENEEYALEIYWLDFPGIHPIRVTHNVVQEHQLWRFVVDEKIVCRQIRLSQQHIFPCVCRTYGELQHRMHSLVE